MCPLSRYVTATGLPRHNMTAVCSCVFIVQVLDSHRSTQTQYDRNVFLCVHCPGIWRPLVYPSTMRTQFVLVCPLSRYLTATGLPRHNMTAVTAPRLDDNGAGYTVTISQTLLIPRDLSRSLMFPGMISSTYV